MRPKAEPCYHRRAGHAIDTRSRVVSTPVAGRGPMGRLRNSADCTERSSALPPPPSDADVDYSNTTDSFLRLIPELGLKLERTKGPVVTLVIDRAEKPSAN